MDEGKFSAEYLQLLFTPGRVASRLGVGKGVWSSANIGSPICTSGDTVHGYILRLKIICMKGDKIGKGGATIVRDQISVTY